MSAIQRVYDFNDGTVFGSRIETEVSALVDKWNQTDAGTTAWTVLTVAGDITVTGAGSGLVCTSPDGLKTTRIHIDNDGIPSFTRIT